MGALPKNKITRAERGKRRKGNTPNITKDPKVTAVPLAKRGLLASILTAAGLGSAKESKETKRRADKKAAKISQNQAAGTSAQAFSEKGQSVKPVSKTARVTQHKG
jgi:hypothetical protein